MKVLNSGKALIVAALAVFSMNFAYAQPANDACSGAIAITCGQTITASNAAATNDAVPACGLSAPRKGVWYTITGTGGLITLSTCSATTNFDTQIAVYTGACGALTCVGSNDNAAGCANFFGRLSTVSFTSTFGTVYRIMVAGKLSASGTFTLAATCAVVAPPNDECANSILVTCGSTTTGSTVGSTTENPGTCGTSLADAAGGVWYRVVGNGGTVTVSLCGSAYDTKVGVFTGTCGALTCVAGNDDSDNCGAFSLQSQVAFSSTAGTTYLILVKGFSSNVGNFTMSVTCGAPPPPPTGFDECAGAITLTPGATCVNTAGTTTGATQSLAAITCAGFTSDDAFDVWYKFTATQATHAVVVDATFDAVIDVRSGACTGTNIGCADANFGDGVESVVLNGLTVGQTYLIRVYEWGGDEDGPFNICVTNGATSLVDGSNNGLATLAQNPEHLEVGNIYPNPAQFGQAFLDIATPEEAVASIQLFDQAGRMVRNMETELYSGVNKVELNVNNLAQGTYFAAVRVNNEVFRKKLIVVQP